MKSLKTILCSIALGVMLVLFLFAVYLVASPKAHADQRGCQTVLWGFFGSQRRLLCDTPILPDGSWVRTRTFYVPAHTNPVYCNSYGGLYWSSIRCSGGGYVDTYVVSQEQYVVTPATVLADEPGHLS